MRYAELLEMLAPAERARLKMRGSRQTLALYRVAHEGVSAGSVVGIGRVPKRWSAARIEELARAMDGGSVPVYRGHPSGSGARTPIGRVVKCLTHRNGGGLETLAVVHLTERGAAEEAVMKKLDAASIEADLEMERSPDGWEVAGVERVTGLALADKKAGVPGFPRAELIAAVRETDENGGQLQERAPADFKTIADGVMDNKNLSPEERRFVQRLMAARIPLDADEKTARDVTLACIDDLAEAKRIYRAPHPAPHAPAERKRGRFDYTDPEYNELIPQ